MKLKIRNRIAFFYLAATGTLTALLFIIIFAVVRKTIYDHIDDKLNWELNEVSSGIYSAGDTVILHNMLEWEEREHSQIELNPAYLEIVDSKGYTIKKSDNLFNSSLEFVPVIKETILYNSTLSGKRVRLLQNPLINNEGKINGYMIIGLPMEEEVLILNNLRRVMVIGCISALLLLFIITRWIAGKSIIPINNVIETAERITRENLSDRIALPYHKDEIYTLTSTVNGLLDRLEDAVLREKQFTSDASHELRTPLSVIKGTLEVLIRKPRDTEQYVNKISFCIQEVNRMTILIDHLLMLARYESDKIEPHKREIELNECILYSINRTEQLASGKGIKIAFNNDKKFNVNADPFMLNVILENLLSNSVKYSNGSKQIDVIIYNNEKEINCSVKDYGIGMSEYELSRIFDRFYRSSNARSVKHPGDGIGLAIVKRLVDLQDLDLKFYSKPGMGTTATIIFRNNMS